MSDDFVTDLLARILITPPKNTQEATLQDFVSKITGCGANRGVTQEDVSPTGCTCGADMVPGRADKEHHSASCMRSK
jgi:hypothetical protein